jgi:hypothetical protein
VDGTEYPIGYANNYAASKGFELKEEYNVYMDAYGNALYVDGVEDEGSYVYISEFASSSGLTTNSKAKAYAYFLDGTDDEVTVEKINGNKTTGASYAAGAITVSGTTYAPNWYKFSKTDAGNYKLTPISNVGGGAVAAGAVTDYSNQGVKINYNGGDLKGNANTKFIVLKSNGDVKVYTGIKNVAKITSDGTTDVTIFTDGSTTYAKYVFVDLNGGTLKGGSTSSDVLFLLKFNKAGNDSSDNEYYRYNAILNGEETKVKIDTTNASLGGCLFGEVEYDDNGYITEMTAVSSAAVGAYSNGYDTDDFLFFAAANATVTQKSSTVTVTAGDGTVEGFYLASGAKIYLIENGGDDVSTISASRLATLYKTATMGASATVSGVKNSDGEYTALYVWDN